MQPTGCLFGYWMSKALGLTLKDQRTISLETGVQNFGLTMAIINLTFTGAELKDTLQFPLSYGLMYFVNSMLLVALYRYYLAPQDDDLIITGEGEGEGEAEAGELSKDMVSSDSELALIDAKM